MDAILPLAQVARYGNVRGTTSVEVLPILEGLFERVLVALPGACTGLDDDAAAAAMLQSMGGLRESIDLLDRPTMREAWRMCFPHWCWATALHPTIRGWCCRLLYEGERVDAAELERLAGLALSHGAGAHEGAAWIEGLLRGRGWSCCTKTSCGWPWTDGCRRSVARPSTRRCPCSAAPSPASNHPSGVPWARRYGACEPRCRRERRRPHRTMCLAIERERAARVVPTLARILGSRLQRYETNHSARLSGGKWQRAHVD